MITLSPLNVLKNNLYKPASARTSFKAESSGDTVNIANSKKKLRIEDLRSAIEKVQKREYGEKAIDITYPKGVNRGIWVLLKDDMPLNRFSEKKINKAFEEYSKSINMEDKEDYFYGINICRELACDQLKHFDKSERMNKFNEAIDKLVSFDRKDPEIGDKVNSTLGVIISLHSIKKPPILDAGEMLEAIKTVAKKVDQNILNIGTDEATGADDANDLLRNAYDQLPYDELSDKWKAVGKQLAKNEEERDKLKRNYLKEVSSKLESSEEIAPIVEKENLYFSRENPIEASTASVTDVLASPALNRPSNSDPVTAVPNLGCKDSSIKQATTYLMEELEKLTPGVAKNRLLHYAENVSNRIEFYAAINNINTVRSKNEYKKSSKDYKNGMKDSERNDICKTLIKKLLTLNLPEGEAVNAIEYITNRVKLGEGEYEKGTARDTMKTAYSVANKLSLKAFYILDRRSVKLGFDLSEIKKDLN